MIWPAADYMLDGTYAPVEAVWRAWADVAHAIAAFQAVSILVEPSQEQVARRYLSDIIERHVVPVDDAWMRDSGPTFVRDSTRPGVTPAVNWQFNAWGGLELAETAADNAIAARVAGFADAPVLHSSMVNEGGGIHVDGRGTALVTATVQLDPRRNPGWSRENVEAELERTIGARRVIWIERGLTRDYGPLGTRGHVDMMATFSEPGVLLVHDQRDDGHPDRSVSMALHARLSGERDASGVPLTTVSLPAPTVLRDAEGWVDYNYANHAVVNGAVIMGEFDDPHDSVARGILRDAYPGRQVIGIDARPIFALGGGIHCITQQQPTA
ncbi:agmatine deiminase [Microbacteriaceae bacterium SG_E_30_P1]|uniref:Agmatine deiminase n=2 Tax=Antiquaquibacter oligotrophicus TaxID=2880260 RepID=A0ABT6KKH5_9MICO|nr:agmatine deiminase [Antiquaquibacter oligotrophicus]